MEVFAHFSGRNLGFLYGVRRQDPAAEMQDYPGTIFLRIQRIFAALR
jgi:hypothetical protein